MYSLDFLVSAYSDIGIRKETNQDSVLVEVAGYGQERIAFAMICDGMGGLDRGELASATVIRAFADWFQNELPQLLSHGFSGEVLQAQWQTILTEQDRKIAAYGKLNGISLGTTVVGILIYRERYYTVNVGDSRVYCIDSGITCMTKDQSLVQREVDAGRMTPQQANVDKRRNILLQCVGASEYMEPAYTSGQVMPGQVYMLCSDGFRHIITEDEMYERLQPERLQTERDMLENAAYLTEMNKQRREEDNISVALVKTY